MDNNNLEIGIATQTKYICAERFYQNKPYINISSSDNVMITQQYRFYISQHNIFKLISPEIVAVHQTTNAI